MCFVLFGDTLQVFFVMDGCYLSASFSNDFAGADPGFGQGGGPSFSGRKLPT